MDRLPRPTLAVVAVERDVPGTSISVKEEHGLVVREKGLTTTKASFPDVVGDCAASLAGLVVRRVVASAVPALDVGAHVGRKVGVLAKFGVASHAPLVMTVLVVLGGPAEPALDGAVCVGHSERTWIPTASLSAPRSQFGGGQIPTSNNRHGCCIPRYAVFRHRPSDTLLSIGLRYRQNLSGWPIPRPSFRQNGTDGPCRRANTWELFWGNTASGESWPRDTVPGIPRSRATFYPSLHIQPTRCVRSSWDKPGSINTGPQRLYSRTPYLASGAGNRARQYSVDYYQGGNT
jgi:hypothetical protein